MKSATELKQIALDASGTRTTRADNIVRRWDAKVDDATTRAAEHERMSVEVPEPAAGLSADDPELITLVEAEAEALLAAGTPPIVKSPNQSLDVWRLSWD